MYAPPYSSDEYSDDSYGDFSPKTIKPRVAESQKVIKVDPKRVIEDQFYEAVINDDVDGVRNALNNDVNVFVDSIITGGWSAMLFACRYGKLDVVKYLLDAGADPNNYNTLYTPLMAACSNRSSCVETILQVVKCLLEHNIDVNFSDGHGTTALMLASQNGHLAVVQLLLDKQAEMNFRDNARWTALFWAVNSNHFDICKVLVEKNCQLDLKDNYDQTPLELALIKDYKEIAELLEFSIYGEQVVTESTEIEVSVVSPNWDDMLPGFNYCGHKEPPYYKDVADMLYGMGLEHLTPLFFKAKISLNTFLCISSQELEYVGVIMPYERKVILNQLINFHMRRWRKNSITKPTNDGSFGVFDFLMQLASILKHVTVIDRSMCFINNKLREFKAVEKFSLNSVKNPEFLNMWRDVDQMNKVYSELETYEVTIAKFCVELMNTKKCLKRVTQNTPKPVDFITGEVKSSEFNWKQKLCSLVSITITICTAFNLM